MLFQRINRSDPEKVFLVVKNGYSTAALTNGQCVAWKYASGGDGVQVTLAGAETSHMGFAAAGVVAETIAIGGYGLLQVYGYHSETRVRKHTEKEVVPGAPLRLSADGSVFALEAARTESTVTITYPCAFALEAQASWTTKTIAVFIKAL